MKNIAEDTIPRVLTPYIELSLQLVFFSTLEITQDTESISWVRCAAGNVFFKLSLFKFLLALVPILTIWWRQLYQFQFWPPDSTTCTSCRFGQQLGLLELVTSLATKCCHLDQFQFWPPGGATCIATLPRIALLASSAGVELPSSSARVTSVKSAKPLGGSELHQDPQIGPQGHLGPIKVHVSEDICRTPKSYGKYSHLRDFHCGRLPYLQPLICV